MSSRSLAAFYVPKLKRSSNRTERQCRQSGLLGSEKETKAAICEIFFSNILKFFRKRDFWKNFEKKPKITNFWNLVLQYFPALEFKSPILKKRIIRAEPNRLFVLARFHPIGGAAQNWVKNSRPPNFEKQPTGSSIDYSSLSKAAQYRMTKKF